MKIAHIVDSMEVGGAETLVAQMCRLQRDQGHQPCVYAVAALGPLGARMREEGFRVEAGIGRHLFDSARAFYRLFRGAPPDAVHLHNPTPTIYAAASARLAGAAGIVSTRHSLVAPPHRRAEEVKYGIAARFCDWVVGVCDATTANLRSLQTIPPRKIVRVYNGVVPLQRVPLENCPPRDGFTLVYVGRLEPIKNHGLLLHALRDALPALPDLRLWMVGDGSERKPLEQLAAELGIASHVRFWGHQLDVAPFFSAADAFIMSSRSEGLPLSLLQGFSLGVPAIVTDVGGMAEVVRLAQAGFAVPPGDAAQMAAAILRMAANPAQREGFSTRAKVAYRSTFSLQAVVDAYDELYRKTARSRMRRPS